MKNLKGKSSKIFSLAAVAVSLCLVPLLFSCGEEKVTVASIIFNDEGEWFREAMKGMQDAASKYNIKFENVNSYYDIDSEFNAAKELAEKGVKAVVYCPIDFDKSAAAADYLSARGIPVVTWNTLINSSNVKSKVIIDSSALGSQTGDYLVGYFERKNLSGVKTAIISNYSYTVSADRCNGFKNSIKPLLDSGKMELVAEIPAELTEETNRNVRQLLEKHGDVGLIWCWNQTTLLSCMKTLKDLGRTDILLCGADLSSDMAREMLDPASNLIVVTTQQPYMRGFIAVENAIVAYSGKDVEDTVVVPVSTYAKEDVDSLNKYLDLFKLN